MVQVMSVRIGVAPGAGCAMIEKSVSVVVNTRPVV